MKQYGKFAALVVVIVGTLVWLGTAGINETKTYYKTIAEVNQMGDRAQDQRIRVAGDVEGGSIQRTSNMVEFNLVQDKLRLKVAYTGTEPLPDTFRDGAQALADGRMGRDGVFHAQKVQAKCASKYEAKPGQLRPGQAPPNTYSKIQLKDRYGKSRIAGCPPGVLSRCVCGGGSVVGKLKRKPFLILSGERAVYSVWLLVTLASGMLVYALLTGDFRLAYVAAAQQPHHADALQVRGLVGRAGRLAAVVELAALHLCGDRGFHEPAQVPRDDAVRDRAC